MTDDWFQFIFIFKRLKSCILIADSYFRKSGMERSEGLAKDLEWFREQGIVIPEPTIPGVSYAKYLEELAERSAPLFLCHYYNIYFSHIAGGQVIAKRVCVKPSDVFAFTI